MITHDLKKYAIHESSHTTFSWLTGSRLVSVSISADGMNCTTVVNYPVFKVLHEISYEHMTMKSWVNGLLAGVAGEMHLMNDLWGELPAFLEDDIKVAMQAMQSTGWTPPNNCTLDKFFKTWGSWARAFTIGYWREISLLANELQSKFQLSGAACAKFLEDIWSEPLPQGVLRHWEHKE